MPILWSVRKQNVVVITELGGYSGRKKSRKKFRNACEFVIRSTPTTHLVEIYEGVGEKAIK
jgi:hypothetical protein